MMEIYRYKVVAKFGLMHMIATNLCEWLYVLVEETKNDMLVDPHLPPLHLSHSSEDTQHSSGTSSKGNFVKTNFNCCCCCIIIFFRVIYFQYNLLQFF